MCNIFFLLKNNLYLKKEKASVKNCFKFFLNFIKSIVFRIKCFIQNLILTDLSKVIILTFSFLLKKYFSKDQSSFSPALYKTLVFLIDSSGKQYPPSCVRPIL
jgi:hypothetical protein